jgi:hypothetical protein
MSSRLDRRGFIQTSLAGSAGLAASAVFSPSFAAEGELLYNGIRLPSPWPPRIKDVPRAPVVPPLPELPAARHPHRCRPATVRR